MMNIWDSVHRGLEKASQEAARISKAQKARSQMERLGKQIAAQEQTLLDRTVALYEAGQLQQNELVPFCQELVSLRQQFVQTQNELQTIQSQMPQPSTTAQMNSADLSMAALPPSTYPSTIERTMPASVPPPPPGSDPTSFIYSSQDNAQDQSATVSVPPPPPGFYASQPTALATGTAGNAVQRRCAQCGTNAQSEDLFCQNCGASLHSDSNRAQPTSRANEATSYATERFLMNEQSSTHNRDVFADQPTIHTTNDSSSGEEGTVRAATDSAIDTQATIRADKSQLPGEDQKPS
jgi:hypothetical protein